MRNLARLVQSALAPLLAVLALAPVALAQDADDAGLDALFAQLRSAPDPATAQRIDQQIWSVWTHPSDPDLASRMGEVLAARGSGNLSSALSLLDELVADFPDYAEGWNQRATIHYMMGNLDLSIADCARVLELEPRHFGALSGRAVIHLQRGDRALAVRDMSAALAIHPFLAERQLFPELVQEITRI